MGRHLRGKRPPRKPLQLHRSRCRQQCLQRPPRWAAVANCRARLNPATRQRLGEQSGRRSGELERTGQWPPGSQLAMTIRACCFPVFLLMGLLARGVGPVRAEWPSILRPHTQAACPQCGGVCCCCVGSRPGASRRHCSLAVRADGAATTTSRRRSSPTALCAWRRDDYQRKPTFAFGLTAGRDTSVCRPAAPRRAAADRSRRAYATCGQEVLRLSRMCYRWHSRLQAARSARSSSSWAPIGFGGFPNAGG